MAECKLELKQDLDACMRRDGVVRLEWDLVHAKKVIQSGRKKKSNVHKSRWFWIPSANIRGWLSYTLRRP